MLTTHSVHHALLQASLAILVALAGSGCTYSMTKLNETPAPFAMPVAAAPAPPMPLVIQRVTVTLNGTPTPAVPTFEKSYADALRESGLFAPVYESSQQHMAPANAAWLSLADTERVNTHQGAALVKGFLIGLSLYLLTPVIPLRGDLSQSVTATLTLPGAAPKQYTAASSGQVTYAMFANGALASNELASKVGTATLQGIVARISEDPAVRAAMRAQP